MKSSSNETQTATENKSEKSAWYRFCLRRGINPNLLMLKMTLFVMHGGKFWKLSYIRRSNNFKSKFPFHCNKVFYVIQMRLDDIVCQIWQLFTSSLIYYCEKFLSATSSLLPYLTIHMQSIGITVEEIAIIYLALPFTTFLAPPITGMFLDFFWVSRKTRPWFCIIHSTLKFHCIMNTRRCEFTKWDLPFRCEARLIEFSAFKQLSTWRFLGWQVWKI